ncbi:MAG: hypothetical protein IKU32_04075 [Clostridia bacterium]|nr:hypothetical protein [Clostridia bacterium]
MKKLLTFILVLTMVMSVSGIAYAVATETDLQTAITNAADGVKTEIVLTGM